MGGNALKEYSTIKYSKDQFINLEKEIKTTIFKLFKIHPLSIPYFRSKSSFGDLDLILPIQTVSCKWRQQLIDHYNLSSIQYINNSNIFSFGLNHFQIDIISLPNDICQIAVDYFSYNDLGNLLGRLIHKLGLKLGFDGLSLVLRPYDNLNYVIDTIKLTADFDLILQILGLNPNIFRSGFDELEDIFKYVMSSKYFNSNIYLFENLSHASRIRDRKRPTYNQFLDYCKLNSNISNYEVLDKVQLQNEIINQYFPQIIPIINEKLKQYQFDCEFKKIFNGIIISNITGLTGKELGVFMSKFKFNNSEKAYLIDNPNYINFLINNT